MYLPISDLGIDWGFMIGNRAGKILPSMGVEGISYDSPEILPFNITVMDVDYFIKKNYVGQITSMMIQEPSSINFHPDGLFSEEIFGLTGSPERMTRFGYIELNTTIIAPVCYKALTKMGNLYDDIMAGRTYAVFNQATKDFEKVIGDPESVEGADTGYSFFMRYYMDIQFRLTDSDARENRVAILNKYRDRSLYKKYIVLPAGLRDLQTDGSNRMSFDDINKLYVSLLAYSSYLPPNSSSPLYDAVRYNIQRKAMEIYEYLENMMTGKRGFLQGSYGRRRVAGGTRNVITAENYSSRTPDDPQAMAPGETKAGVFQNMKAMQPLIVYGFNTVLVHPIFGERGTASTIPLINPDTMLLEYHEVDGVERQKFTSAQGVEAWINRFRNIDVRNQPITIKATNGKKYYLLLVYDTKSRVALCRSIHDLKASLLDERVDPKKLRPITWIEFFYMLTYNAAQGKHAFVTRYPVIQDESCYPSKIHVVSTSPARVVKMINLLSPGDEFVYPEYPILGASYIDSIIPDSSKLKGLGADRPCAMHDMSDHLVTGGYVLS